jgi:DNA-binding NarL/FixJ family response regulator
MTTATPISSSRSGVDGSATVQTRQSHSQKGGIDVLVADDRRATSYQAWALLSSQNDVHAVSTGERMDQVMSLAARHASDLVMVSAAFGGSEGLRLTHRLKGISKPPPVLIYGTAVDSRLAGAAMIAGGDGVFDLETGAERLAGVLARVGAGEQVFPALVPDPFRELADRVDEGDRRIVAMLLLRVSPDEIARALGISANSLRARRAAIVRRLDAAYASPAGGHRVATPQV